MAAPSSLPAGVRLEREAEERNAVAAAQKTPRLRLLVRDQPPLEAAPWQLAILPGGEGKAFVRGAGEGFVAALVGLDRHVLEPEREELADVDRLLQRDDGERLLPFRDRDGAADGLTIDDGGLHAVAAAVAQEAVVER
jgi:hypothetical protein